MITLQQWDKIAKRIGMYCSPNIDGITSFVSGVEFAEGHSKFCVQKLSARIKEHLSKIHGINHNRFSCMASMLDEYAKKSNLSFDIAFERVINEMLLNETS